MRTETIEIDDRFGVEFQGKYMFSEISWARRSRIIQKYTKYHPMTGQVASSDFVAIQAELIIASLKEQPANKPITLEKLLSETDGIPIELGQLLSKAARLVCGLSEAEEKNLSSPSEMEGHIQASQDSDSAKNLGGPLTSLEGRAPK